MTQKTIAETLELLQGLEIAAKAIAKISKDKKVNAEDLPTLVELASEFEVLVKAFSNLDEVPEELKDLEESIYQHARYVYEHECMIVDAMLSKGDIPNASKDELKAFARSRCNIVLNALGYKSIFDETVKEPIKSIVNIGGEDVEIEVVSDLNFDDYKKEFIKEKGNAIFGAYQENAEKGEFLLKADVLYSIEKSLEAKKNQAIAEKAYQIAKEKYSKGDSNRFSDEKEVEVIVDKVKVISIPPGGVS